MKQENLKDLITPTNLENIFYKRVDMLGFHRIH